MNSILQFKDNILGNSFGDFVSALNNIYSSKPFQVYILLFTVFYLNPFHFRTKLKEIMQSLRDHGSEYLSSRFRNSKIGRATYSNALSSVVIKEGGYVGGLVNEGNSCFMNSVLQSLASSKQLMDFLDNRIINACDEDESSENKEEEEEEEEEEEALLETNSDDADVSLSSDVETIHQESQNGSLEKETSTKQDKKKQYGKRKKRLDKATDQALLNRVEDKEADINFSVALKDLLDRLNAKHFNSKPNFRTNKLLRTMTKKPNSNVILGYDQEDAQEFFQTLLDELEKNVKSLSQLDGKPAPEPVHYKDIPASALMNQENLEKVGTVYIPTTQIDPNTKDTSLYTPFKLVTPLDGVTCERIGCLECGENGGIRYSVFSGMSLNLPGEKFGVTLKLSELLNEWSKPEIIDGVNCNRCGLLSVRDYLLENIKANPGLPDKLLNAYKDKLTKVELLLTKSVIDDEDYQKFKTPNMVVKSSKSKQILISRPPPLLSIHINRSCFDPRTYTIRKNNSRIAFKKKLNLIPWCCKPDEINLDARLPMSKKEEQQRKQFEVSSSEDENVDTYYKNLHSTFEKEFQDSDEDDELDEYDDNIPALNGQRNGNRGLVSDSESEDSEKSSDVFEKPVDSLGNSISSSDDSGDEEDSENGDDNDVQVKEDGSVSFDKAKKDNSDPAADLEDIVNGDDESFVDIHDADEREDRKAVGDGEEEDDDDDEEEGEEDDSAIPLPTLKGVSSSVPDGPLTYNLRSVIVHYGTHNYGHYIAFRRYRGCWWRISDENAYVVDEKEVLSTPGTFMLFYEYDYDSETGKLKDDLETDRMEKSLEIEIERKEKLRFQEAEE